MAFKIAAGFALSILFGGIAALILWTIVILWKQMVNRIRKRMEEYDVQDDYYTEEDFDFPEMDKDIQAKQMEQELKERIKDWFAENDIEMQEEE